MPAWVSWPFLLVLLFNLTRLSGLFWLCQNTGRKRRERRRKSGRHLANQVGRSKIYWHLLGTSPGVIRITRTDWWQSKSLEDPRKLREIKCQNLKWILHSIESKGILQFTLILTKNNIDSQPKIEVNNKPITSRWSGDVIAQEREKLITVSRKAARG